MQALTTTGKLFKQFIQFLREQGYQIHWHDINPEEPEYVEVICNGQHLMPDGVPSIPNDGIVEIDCAFHAIRPPSPPTSGHPFHAHPARQSERSDAGLHC